MQKWETVIMHVITALVVAIQKNSSEATFSYFTESYMNALLITHKKAQWLYNSLAVALLSKKSNIVLEYSARIH